MAARPCTCGKVKTCAFCHLYERSDFHNRLWGGPGLPAGTSRVPQPDRSPAPPPAPDPPPYSGAELKALLAEFGIKPTASCSCNGFARKMDGWGADVTPARRAEAVAWLEKQRRGTTWGAAFRAYLSGARHALSGGFVPDPGDVAGSLVDEAVRRAKVKCGAAPNVSPAGESATPADPAPTPAQ